MAYTEDEIASAYAYYGVELLGVEPCEIEGTLEDVVMSVLESPLNPRFVSTMPALLVKNREALDFKQLVGRAKQNPEYAAKLGYILEVTIAAMQELKGTKHYRNIEVEFRALQTELNPSDTALLWMPEELPPWIPDEDLFPKDTYEKKWNICSKFELTRFKDHIEVYVRDA